MSRVETKDKSSRKNKKTSSHASAGTITSSYISQDEMEFLSRAGAIDKMQEENQRRERGERKKDEEPPAPPIKTMIIVLIVFTIAAISAWTTMQGLEPYANIASNEDFAAFMELMGTASSSSSGATTDLTEQTRAAANLYSYKWLLVAGIAGLGFIIELTLLIIWRIRSNRWDARMSPDE